MLGVVLVRLLAGHLTQRTRDQPQPLGLEARQHGPDEAAADRVRLDQDERTLEGVSVMRGTLSGSINYKTNTGTVKITSINCKLIP